MLRAIVDPEENLFLYLLRVVGVGDVVRVWLQESEFRISERFSH